MNRLTALLIAATALLLGGYLFVTAPAPEVAPPQGAPPPDAPAEVPRAQTE